MTTTTLRSFRLPDSLLDRLDNEAEARHVSTNWIVIRILTEGLERLGDAEDFKVTT